MDNETEVSQREMLKIIGLFRKNGFKGEYETFEKSKEETGEYFVVVTDENTHIKGLFKANPSKDMVAFQHVLNDHNTVA
ncbi:hypothetical protein IWT5_01156 [Secundilactobacillus silagincola]|uniref:Uncharacterized protein n=1 Tax=Secundilactobacillus silagincola TaxID=1714681 RepID=A0A1Z5J1S8_9LACO|nr:hypothetical protein [Secundilactobacillus silagincola]GAX08005.1 hypothetical protein IWT5_01156 [Secundilactobacillus silagincola]